MFFIRAIHTFFPEYRCCIAVSDSKTRSSASGLQFKMKAACSGTLALPNGIFILRIFAPHPSPGA